MKIEKTSDAQLGRSFEFSLPKEWSRQEQIDYTTEYIQKTFVDKGMCADWSIHDKGDGNPHVHLLGDDATIQSRPLMGEQRNQGLGVCQR